jgi:type IV pilus assembly protein PilM
MADESIWKKEISFGRKRKEEETPKSGTPDEATSVWKKEISFGRKKKQEDAPDQEVVAEASDEEPVSEETWTRAVSFGRKSQTEPVAEDTVVDEPAPVVEEPVLEVPVVEEPAAEETWTRAVSFGRKSQPEPVAEEPVAEEPVVEETAPAVQPPAAEEPVFEVPVVDDPAPVIPLPTAEEPVSEPVAPEPAPDPVGTESHEFDAASGSDPVALSAQPAAEAPAAEEPVWRQEVSFNRAPAEVASTIQPEPAPEPEPLPEPVAVAPAEVPPALEPEPEPLPEPVAVAPAEVPPPAPGVQAPVTADELTQQDEPEPEKKVPFWKKEIGGKKKAPKAAAVAATAAAVAVTEESEPAQKVPFWKKEIGGKKKAPKAAAVAATAAAVAVTEESEPAQKVPFWKKEIGGKKTPKGSAPKEPKAKKEKQPKEPKAPKQRKAKQPKVKAARGSRGAKRITGLKIGASQLAAARVANNGSAELLQTARTDLNPGIVVGGELRDPDALAEALKGFFAENNLPKKGVRLGIANNRIGVRMLEISGIGDDKQLANAIRFRAQEVLPIPIDEAVLDYQVLGEGTDDQGQPTKRVLLVVAYRELIDRYMDACKKAGISLIGIDLEAFALLRALQAPQDGVGGDSAAALVAVAIGHDRSTFAVSDGRVCEFTRVLEWGGSALNVAIARALDAAPSEVDGVKRALALTDEMVPEGLSDDQAKKARDAMRRAIQTFARELVSSLQYYQNQPGSLGIGEIVLTGGTAHLAGLAGELERLIGVRVRVGDPLARMKVSKKVGEAEQVGSLAVAIGLGIED